MQIRFGIVDESGTLYPCAYGCHESAAKVICLENKWKTIYDDAYDDDDSAPSGHTSYCDILLSHGYCLFGVDMFFEPYVTALGKLSSGQKSTLDFLINEMSFMSEKELFKIANDNVEKYSNNTFIMPQPRRSFDFIMQLFLELKDDLHPWSAALRRSFFST